MDRRIDRGRTTRNAILNDAIGLFAEHGYEAVSIELVLQSSGVSRGALYHHFANKAALFAAALEHVEQDVARRIAAAAASATNPLDALRAGCAQWLQLANDAVVRRIVLVDAPSVIGWQAWRAIDDQNALGMLKAALGAASAAGRFRASLVDTYAHLLLAALIEMALLVAQKPGDTALIEATSEAVETLVSRLLGFAPNDPWQQL